MKPNHLRDLFINYLVLITLGSFLYFCYKYNPDILTKTLQKNYDFLPNVGLIGLIHLIALGIIYTVFFKQKQSRLADSSLLTPKQLIQEQRRMKNEIFAIRKGNFFSARRYRKDKSGLPISRNVKLLTKKSYEHVLLLGPTGSGKSSVVYIPILQSIDNTSIVVTDPKGELFRKTKADLEARGYWAIHLDFNDHENSAHYSLMGNCKNIDDLRKLADSIISAGSAGEKDDSWGKMAKSLLMAFMCHEFDLGNKDMTNVVRLMAEKKIEELEMFFMESSEAARMEFFEVQKYAGAENTLGSVYITLQGRLQVFKYFAVQQIGSSSDFTADDLRLKKVALFVSYPEDESAIYSSYIASFFYQIFNKTKTHWSVDENKSNGEGLGIVFLMDEFANIGKVPEIHTLLATVRSKKMSIVLGIQSFSQLRIVYGLEPTNTIVENCKTKIILPGATGQTAKFFSELIGEEEFKQTSFSSNKKVLEYSTSESLTKKAIVSMDQLRRTKTYNVLIVSDNLKPIIDDKNFYFRNDIMLFCHKHLPFSESTNDKIGRLISDILKPKKKEKKKEEIKQQTITAKIERRQTVQESREKINVAQKQIVLKKTETTEEKTEQMDKETMKRIEKAKKIFRDLDEF